MKTAIIPDAEYSESMQNVILPYVERMRLGGEAFFERVPGQPIRYERFRTDQTDENGRSKGEVVLFHGYTEGITKFYECIYYFLKEGYDVSMMEHRGHGRSYRMISDRFKVLLPSEKDMLEDMHYFVTEIVGKDAGSGQGRKALYLYGHSMGGGLGARFIEEWPEVFDRAILTSPMLALNNGNTPKWLMVLAAKIIIAAGKGEQLIPGSVPFNPEDKEGDYDGSSATSRERYAWYHSFQLSHPDYQTSATTWITALTFFRITKAVTAASKCAAVKCPVMLFQAEDDNMVGADGQERFMARIPAGLGRMKKIPGSRHEIYRSSSDVLEKYWPAVFDFLEGKEA